ncbi:Receptor-like serine/threonine-protein kinase SD1-8 [Linum grandiflorum]
MKLLVPFSAVLVVSILSHLCFASDRITPDQPLRSNQTIVSAGGVFELGFFSPANSTNSYVGIWYHNISPRTVVWVANRNNPITNLSSSEFSIWNGTLSLCVQPGVPIWTAEFTASSSTLEAVLQDDGNFWLNDSNFSSSYSSQLPWQSFNYPTDTLLPGQILDSETLAGLISWKSDSDPAQGPYSVPLYRRGTTSFVTFYNNVTMYTIPENKFLTRSPEDTGGYEDVYFTFNSSRGEKTRIVINSNGMVQGLSWVKSAKSWSLNWQEPRDLCQVFSYCGPFGTCDNSSSPLCSCPRGFVPKSLKQWVLGDFSGGCVRKSRLGCMSSGGGNDANGDMFVPGYGLPNLDGQFSIAGLSYSVGNVQQCELICSYSCNCTAYSYQRNKCSIWSGELFNLRTLRKDRYSRSVYLRVAGSGNSDDVSYQNENPDHVRSSRKRIFIGAIVGSVVIGILVSLLGLFLILRRKSMLKAAVNKYGIVAGDDQNNTQLSFYSFKDVSAATDNFSESNKLGEGGFGPVYKGKLSGDQEVAMKRLSKKSGQGLEEFMNELKLIAKLQHTYLVRLLGCCVEREEKILIYEYMPNRSLDKFLFGSSDQAKLNWGQRVKIAEGVAQGLLYIHKYSRLKVIHRDMKASNVLLDAAMNPKISDFGMARIFGIDQDEANTNRIVGTYGYMSPEYAIYGQFSEKSDVFSFGVLLLEIVSGKRNKDFYHEEIPFSLLCWVWELWKEGKPEELIDPAVKNRPCCNPTEAVKFIHVGLLCVQDAPTDRPTMSSVTQMLSSNDSQSFPSPGEPAFITRRAAAETNDQVAVNCSNNQITMSLPTGR